MRLTHALLACTLALLATTVLAQRRTGGSSGSSDEQIVQTAQRVASSGRVDLYQHGLTADPALAEAADRALTQMERLLGTPMDQLTLGARVRIYVAAGTTVSHVWRGYDHPGDPQAILFLNPMVARFALTGRNATYAHELAHLLTWRFASHTLREGLADYLALQLHPGAGVGPNVEGYAQPPAVAPELQTYLGTTFAPPAALMSDAQFRKAYYFASYQLVNYLVQSKDMATFLKLYASADPEAQYSALYGKTRLELVILALAGK